MGDWNKLFVSVIDKPSRALNAVLYVFIATGLALALIITLLGQQSLTIRSYNISLVYWHYILSALLIVPPLIILMQTSKKTSPQIVPPDIDRA